MSDTNYLYRDEPLMKRGMKGFKVIDVKTAWFSANNFTGSLSHELRIFY